MKKTSLKARHLAAWAGMTAPVLFVAVFTILGCLRPGYDPLSTYVSVLALGKGGWIQQVNFIILGVLMVVFSNGIAAEFQTGKAARSGPALMRIMAFLFIVSGLAVMDPTGTPPAQASVHGIIHGLAGGIIFLLMPVTCFVFLRRFHAESVWRPFQGWTLTLGNIIATAVILLTLSSKLPQIQNVFVDWLGLIQRMIIIPFMLWMALFALKINQRLKQKEM